MELYIYHYEDDSWLLNLPSYQLLGSLQFIAHHFYAWKLKNPDKLPPTVAGLSRKDCLLLIQEMELTQRKHQCGEVDYVS